MVSKLGSTNTVLPDHKKTEPNTVRAVLQQQESVLLIILGNDGGVIQNRGQQVHLQFYRTRISGRYAPLILAPAEGSSLEPCTLDYLII